MCEIFTVRLRSLFFSLLKPLDERSSLVVDLLSELLGDVLLGHLLGPLQDDLLLKHVLLEKLFEDVGHLRLVTINLSAMLKQSYVNLRKERSLEGLNSFLNPSDQILLTFGVLMGEAEQ